MTGYGIVNLYHFQSHPTSVPTSHPRAPTTPSRRVFAVAHPSSSPLMTTATIPDHDTSVYTLTRTFACFGKPKAQRASLTYSRTIKSPPSTQARVPL